VAVGLYSGVSGLALGIGLYRNVSGLWGGASGLINGFGGADPYAGASLYLNFLDPTLDSRITFSRGTNATLIDSTGRLTYAPNNTITNSVGPSASTGTAVATVSGAAPNGTNAVRLSKTDATTPRYSSWITSFTVQGNTAYVASAYFKYDGFNTTVSLEYNNVTHFGTAWVATFNVTASGITANAPSACTSGVQAIGDGWFRVWAAFTSGTPSAPTSPTFLTQITGGAGTSVLVAWGQLEAVTYQTTPSPYVATTASAYYGPRFDYDPVTLAPRGLLIEEARTNLLTYSQDWTNAAWSVINATITANATASPDGTINADLVTYTGGASNGPRQLVSASAGAKTYSFYVKNSSGARYFQILTDGSVQSFANYDLQTQTTGTVGTSVSAVSIINAGNGWYRLTMTATDAIATNVYIGLVASLTAGWSAGASSGAFFVYGAQLEAGSFATSYIPTVASTVSRSADVATMTGTNFSTWYNQAAGTFVIDADSYTIGSADYPLTASDGTSNNRFGFYRTTATIAGYVTTGAVDQMYLTRSSIATNTPYKAAVTATANDGNMALNGTAAAGDTSITMPTLDRLSIGSNNSSGFMSGHIRAIAYYNTRLPNTSLQTLTAPSLASPLALDFLSTTYTVGY